MIVMLCISTAMWIYWLIVFFGNRHPMHFRDRRPKIWHPLVVLLTLLVVGFTLTTSTIEQVKKIKKAREVKIAKENENKLLSENAHNSDIEPETTKEPEIDHKRRLKLNLQIHFFLLLIMGIPFYLISQEQIDDFGFRKSKVGSQIADGCVGFIGALAPVFLAMMMSIIYRTPEKVHPLLKLVGPDLGWGNFALLTITAIVTAPLWEELLYRVLLQGFLQDHMKPQFAIVLTSLVFGFIHGWPDMIPIFTLSLVLGYFFYRTNSYLTVVVLHALFNLYNLLNVML